jgi:hypothetical protein
VYISNVKEARQRDLIITATPSGIGQATPLFTGLDTWFDRINRYGAARGLGIEHYIISSGTHEMIEGSPIASHFKGIYASRFIYDRRG